MENSLISSKEAFSKAAHLCSRSEKCASEIRKKLVEWGLEKYDAEAVVDKLKSEKYIDDKRYSKAFVREKFRINKWGRTKIIYHLKHKGLSENSIAIGLDEIDESNYISLLVKTMKEKAKSIKSTNRFEKMGKIIRFTQGRGFEAQLIHKYMNEVLK